MVVFGVKSCSGQEVTIGQCNRDQKIALKSCGPRTDLLLKAEYVFFEEGGSRIYTITANGGTMANEVIIPCSTFASGLYYLETRTTYADGTESGWCNNATFEGCDIPCAGSMKWKLRIKPAPPGGTIRPLPPGGVITPIP